MTTRAPFPYEPHGQDRGGADGGPGAGPGGTRPPRPPRSKVRTLAPLAVAAWIVLEIWLLTLLGQAAGRLQSLALLYAFIFFMAGIFPALLFPEERALLFSTFWYGGTSVVAIAMALAVAWVVGSRRFALGTVMAIGLAFEVLGSYGIAIAEFTTGVDMVDSGRVMGHSWVAVWTVLFTVVVPSRPRRAAVAALASVSAVPVVIGVN